MKKLAIRTKNGEIRGNTESSSTCWPCPQREGTGRTCKVPVAKVPNSAMHDRQHNELSSGVSAPNRNLQKRSKPIGCGAEAPRQFEAHQIVAKKVPADTSTGRFSLSNREATRFIIC